MPLFARISRYIFFSLSILLVLIFFSRPFELHRYCVNVVFPSIALLPFYKKVFYPVGFLLGLGFFLLGLLSPRLFCGFVCPLGTAQEILILPAKRLKINGEIDKRTNEKLSLLAFLVFLALFAGSAIYKDIFCIRGCPIIWTCVIGRMEIPPLTIILLSAFFISVISTERAFCRYFCPFGYVLGVISRWSIFKLKREIEICNECRLCEKECPMKVDILGAKEYIISSMCISCFRCLRICGRSAIRLRRHR